ncbi:MAG: thiamine pyrophosphate-binding protein, partial [Janthinobacterium lividum]
GLMGNGNMFVMEAIGRQAKVIHVRHEHSAVSMADGYGRLTGRPGVALITNGPGFTQIMTALAVAARAGSPIVVIAGDACQDLPFHVHTIDQAPLATAAGAAYIAVRSAERLPFDLARAFHMARSGSVPVVMGIPEDMQKVLAPARYEPSARYAVAPQKPAADPARITAITALLMQAKRPVVLAGRGVSKQAAAVLSAIGDRIGALMTTSLLGKGPFRNHPFDIGVAGGLSSPLAKELLAQADLVLAVGAALGHYTTEGGKLFAGAKTIQVSLDPEGLHEGVRTADLHVVGDAATVSGQILAALPGQVAQGWRTEALGVQIAAHVADPAEFPIKPGELDPRSLMARIDAVIPKDWHIVCGVGHYFFFAMAGLSGRDPDRVTIISEFATIGSALPIALAIAAERQDGRVLMIDGDGSMMMHIQELETAQRNRIKLLMLVFNDGAYGAELHKLRAQGLSVDASVHGRCDLAGVARAFGLQAATLTALDGLESLMAEYLAGDGPALWDAAVSDAVPAPQYRW